MTAAHLSNPLLVLLADGYLDRADLAPSLDSAEAGVRASRVFDVSREHYGTPASLRDLIEARAALGLPASVWAIERVPIRPRRSSRRRSPSDIRRAEARAAEFRARIAYTSESVSA